MKEPTYRLTARAAKAATPEALALREGSARYKLMRYAFRKGAPMTRAELAKAAGDAYAQALRGMLKYGFLTAKSGATRR